MDLYCNGCIFFGTYHEKGSLPTAHGVVVIDEPYVMCLKRNYAVLVREVPNCKEKREN